MTRIPHPIFTESLPEETRAAVLKSQKVRAWLDRVGCAFDVREVIFDRVVAPAGRVLFVFARAMASAPGGNDVPGIALIRGDSVAVLVVLIAPDGREYTVLVRQPRLPIGQVSFEEIPAGMVDEGGFHAKAIDELNEEVGADLQIREEHLQHLETCHTTPGLCDEAISIFAARVPVSDALITALSGRRTGQAGEHEDILVEVIPLHDLAFKASADLKSRVAYYSYCSKILRELPR